ncbi:hypothetical protein [Ferrimonas marina]|uniref:Uncharacterized protein n=1 Tax=Ferrimonas marina TaxID=299255 RepID=A0A1M5UJN2_9GAMM|nr:hypothetical protein [Ferrimonas marina]SHH63131.1 hypothetical protein SAMN02745129_2601 [Ferrimonas marina]
MIVLSSDAFMRLIHSADRAAETQPHLKALKLRLRRDFLCLSLFGMTFDQARYASKNTHLIVQWHTTSVEGIKRHSLTPNIVRATIKLGLDIDAAPHWYAQYFGMALGGVLLELEPHLHALYLLAKKEGLSQPRLIAVRSLTDNGEPKAGLYQFSLASLSYKNWYLPCTITPDASDWNGGLDHLAMRIVSNALSQHITGIGNQDHDELYLAVKEKWTTKDEQHRRWLDANTEALLQSDVVGYFLDAAIHELTNAEPETAEDYPELAQDSLTSRRTWTRQSRINWAIKQANERIGLHCHWGELSSQFDAVLTQVVDRSDKLARHAAQAAAKEALSSNESKTELKRWTELNVVKMTTAYNQGEALGNLVNLINAGTPLSDDTTLGQARLEVSLKAAINNLVGNDSGRKTQIQRSLDKLVNSSGNDNHAQPLEQFEGRPDMQHDKHKHDE